MPHPDHPRPVPGQSLADFCEDRHPDLGLDDALAAEAVAARERGDHDLADCIIDLLDI